LSVNALEKVANGNTSQVLRFHNVFISVIAGKGNHCCTIGYSKYLSKILTIKSSRQCRIDLITSIPIKPKALNSSVNFQRLPAICKENMTVNGQITKTRDTATGNDS
jgi:hypothetical protein